MKILPDLKLTGNLSFSDSESNYKKNTKNIDLNKFHNTLINTKKIMQEKPLIMGNMNMSHMLYELFDLEFLRSFSKYLTPILDTYIGYSSKYNSLTISILDKNNDVKAIAIRNAFDVSGNKIKWKSYGSKKYIPYKITGKKDIYIAVGMAEYVLFELIDFDYILLQSDCMYKHISSKLINQCLSKNIIILKENDESYESLIQKLKRIFFESNLYVIDFEECLNKKLPKGYDFRDLCNEKKDLTQIKKIIEKREN